MSLNKIRGVVASDPAAEDPVVGEPRWPMASAVLAAIVLTILMPDDLRLGPNWLLSIIVGVLLVAEIVGDPGRIDRRTAQLRALSLGLICVLVFSALWATVLLTSHLISGGKETDSAGALLEAGSTVWLSNIIAFALLYWELDGGGAAERAHRSSSRRVDFAFPQQMNPELAPADWRPQFVDYLYLGFTNATAFSPTDAMPLAPRAKIAMTVQALISLVVLGLVRSAGHAPRVPLVPDPGGQAGASNNQGCAHNMTTFSRAPPQPAVAVAPARSQAQLVSSVLGGAVAVSRLASPPDRASRRHRFHRLPIARSSRAHREPERSDRRQRPPR